MYIYIFCMCVFFFWQLFAFSQKLRCQDLMMTRVFLASSLIFFLQIFYEFLTFFFVF